MRLGGFAGAANVRMSAPAHTRHAAPAQVSLDWGLDTSLTFKAVAYLDSFLSRHPVDQLSRWAA